MRFHTEEETDGNQVYTQNAYGHGGRSWWRGPVCRLRTGGAMAPADEAPADDDMGEAKAEEMMGPSEVKFWTYQDFLLEGHIGNDLLLEFQEANPNVDLALTPTHIGSGSKEKLITAAAAGAPPDVFYMDRYLAGQLSAPGFLLNLNEHIKATGAFSWEDIWPKLRDDCTWKGNIYGVGLHTDARTYMFNVDHFIEAGLDPEAPPTTWDELESATLLLHKAGQDGVIERLGYSTGPPGNPPVGLQWYIHFWQQGGEYLSPDNKTVNFDNDMGVTALKFMINMVDLCGGNVRIDEFLGQQRPDRNDAFTTGGVSQMIGGHWYAATYRKAWESAINFKSAPYAAAAGWHRDQLPGWLGAGTAAGRCQSRRGLLPHRVLLGWRR